jgi:hypothetical protein
MHFEFIYATISLQSERGEKFMKVAVVTGGAKGIGSAIVKRFIKVMKIGEQEILIDIVL